MRTIKIILSVIIISLFLIVPCYADRTNVYSINNCDVVVATVSGHTGSIESFADDMYDYGGFSEDGILLVIDTVNRECHICTSGSCIETFDSAAMQKIESRLLPYLRQNDWEGAEEEFVTVCRSYLYSGIRGLIYKLIACLGLGGVLGGTPLQKYKKEMVTVKSKSRADDYLKPGSVRLVGHTDNLLRTAMTKTPIPRVESNGPPGGGHSSGGGVHVGSSGTSHGGHSFKF